MRQSLEGFDKAEGVEISMDWCLLTDLTYIDDTILFVTNTDAMQQLLESVKNVSKKYDLSLTVPKTKRMLVDTINKNMMQVVIMIHGQAVEAVDQFNYRGLYLA